MEEGNLTKNFNRTFTNITTKLTRNQYTTPVYLTFPSDVPEDHITFLFGILLLASIAISCTFIILKLTKPKFASVPSGISYTNAPMEYDWMMFMPYQQRRRSSSFLFLRGMICRNGSRRSRRTSLSIVSHSNSSMTTILPSYRSATGSTISPSTTASIPPPPYEELQTLTSSTYSTCNDTDADAILRDANNNRRINRIR